MDKTRFREAKNLFQQGQIEKCYAICQELIDASPHPEVHHLLSMVMTQLGDTEQALKEIDAAISLLPNSSQLHNTQGNIFLRSRQVNQAKDSYLKAIELNADYAPAHNNLGNCHLKLNQFKESKACYLKAIAIEPLFVDAHFNYGRLLLAQRNLPSARYVLLHAYRLNPRHPAVIGQLAEIAIHEGEFDDAIDYCSERLKIQPTHADTYHTLGTALFQQDQFSDAADAFSYSIKLGTRASDAHYNLASAYIEMGDFKSALKHYHQQLEVEAMSDAYYNIGVILMAQDHHNDALSYFQSAAETDPDNTETLLNMGAINLKKGNREEAIKIYQQVLSLEPDNAEITHVLEALIGKNTPEQSPPDYVKNLFNHYANYYDKHLEAHLHYDVPQQLAKAIEEESQCGDTEQWRILDLGCGTGLVGEQLKHLAKQLIGIDISEKMIAHAEKKQIYHDLSIGDITLAFKTHRDIDLVVAGDVFTYIGNLNNIFLGVKVVLKSGALFAFTVEKTNEENYILQKTIRYAHNKHYIETLIEKNDFITERFANITLRRQHGHPIEGYLVILRKP